MRPPILRSTSDERSIVVGADATASTDSGFWKGMFIGAGGILILGASVSLIGASINKEADRQNREDEQAGMNLRASARARARDANRKLNRDDLLAGKEKY